MTYEIQLSSTQQKHSKMIALQKITPPYNACQSVFLTLRINCTKIKYLTEKGVSLIMDNTIKKSVSMKIFRIYL